jgi:hypothetical protein
MARRVSGAARLPLRHVLLVAAAMLAGCRSDSLSYRWERPNGSRADFDRDAYVCERDIRQSPHVNRLTVGGYFEREAGPIPRDKRDLARRFPSKRRNSPSLYGKLAPSVLCPATTDRRKGSR